MPSPVEAGGRRERLPDFSLALFWKVPPRHLRRIRALVRQARLPFPWTRGDIEGFSPSLRELLWPLPGPEEIRRFQERLAEFRIRFLCEEDADYPDELRHISDGPPYLFLRGDPFAGDRSARVGIIGSRAASEAGREIAFSLARDLALAGCTVLSGLARGIDGEGHRGALSAGGRTLAVLGTGPDVCYPPEHAGLLEEILRRGGIVSEFPPGVPGLKLHFPRRNRILAALCDVLVVVEGGERSGARSTVDHALDLGREVMAVPREILLSGSVLPNRLIRDGAHPVLGPGDVLSVLEERGVSPQVPLGAPESSGGDRGNLGQELLSALRAGARDLDGCLVRMPHADAGSLQAALMHLELMGWVRRQPGGRYTLATRN